MTQPGLLEGTTASVRSDSQEGGRQQGRQVFFVSHGRSKSGVSLPHSTSPAVSNRYSGPPNASSFACCILSQSSVPPAMSPRRPLPAKATKSEQDAALGGLRAFWRLGRRMSGEILKTRVKRKRLNEKTTRSTNCWSSRNGSERNGISMICGRFGRLKECLSWSNFTVLMRLTDATKRKKFARLAVRKALSSDSLWACIQAADPGGNRRAGSGRKSLADAPLKEAVLRIRRQIGRLRRQLDAMSEVDGISQGRGSQVLSKQKDNLLAVLTEFEEAVKTHASGQLRSKARKAAH